MLPDPLHPALVHFPIVFMILLPVVLAGALWMMKRGAEARRTWILRLIAAGALKDAFETHEAAADRFMLLSLGVLAITAAGLAKGKTGSVARGAALAGALSLAVVGYQVGHSGGALVYRHGAASAYAGDQAAATDEDEIPSVR